MIEVASYKGGTTPLQNDDVAQFRAGLDGVVLLQGSEGYEHARTVWNAAIDRRPALIARCTGATDVVKALCFARRHHLLTSIRCGGHNASGAAVAEDGLMIDLTPMSNVDVDPERGIAVVGGGATLGALDKATQAHGLATTAGVVSHTGVGGLTLGGGVGRLARKFGLACDNLTQVELVTADGDQLIVSDQSHPDLFWAVRGGGGNFGIVTAFTFRLHPIGTEVMFASAMHRLDDAGAALRFLLDFGRRSPREITTAAAFVTADDGSPVFSMSATHIAPLDDAVAALEPLVKFGTPLQTRMEVRPYLHVQSDADAVFPYGQRYYWKTHFIRDFPDEAIRILVDLFRRVPNARSLIAFQQYGGAIGDIPPGATAFANRDAQFDFIPVGIWQDAADEDKIVPWVRDVWWQIKPFGSGGVYLNNIGPEDTDRLREAFGGNLERLMSLKARYDPANFFRMNANIQPAQDAAAEGHQIPA
jgi:hypothetical protein